MSSSNTTGIISVVGLGKYRDYGLQIEECFTSTPYRLTAFIDLTGEPEAFRYDAHNLGVVLRALHPRPKVFVIGAAISPEMAQESKRVFEKYREDTIEEDPFKTLIINVSPRSEVYFVRLISTGGYELCVELICSQLCDEPPTKRGEWAAAIMERLDNKYKGRTW